MPARPKLADPGALIRDGKRRTDTFRACMDPDLVSAYEVLVDERERLVEERDVRQETARDSLASKADTPELDKQLADLDKQLADLQRSIDAATVVLTFQSLPRPQFRALMDKHPPRKDADGNLTHPQDTIGCAYEPFFDELLRVSLVSPDLDAGTVDILFDERLTDRAWEQVTNVVWGLNRAMVNVPFSSAVSPNRRSSSKR